MRGREGGRETRREGGKEGGSECKEAVSTRARDVARSREAFGLRRDEEKEEKRKEKKERGD